MKYEFTIAIMNLPFHFSSDLKKVLDINAT